MTKKKTRKKKADGTLKVRYCTVCEMYHTETSEHLTDKQFDESQKYDVYHANDTIYFSPEAVEDQYE